MTITRNLSIRTDSCHVISGKKTLVCEKKDLHSRFLPKSVEVSNDQDPCSSLLLLVEPIRSSLDEDRQLCLTATIWDRDPHLELTLGPHQKPWKNEGFMPSRYWWNTPWKWGFRDVPGGFLVTQSTGEFALFFLHINWCIMFSMAAWLPYHGRRRISGNCLYCEWFDLVMKIDSCMKVWFHFHHCLNLNPCAIDHQQKAEKSHGTS